jgi:subtilisin family serine protease
MAAPATAGVAAVIMSYFPKLSAAQVKQVIMDSGLSVDAVVKLGGDGENTKAFRETTKSGKMVNLYNALILASKL